MRYRIVHKTTYSYQESVPLGYNETRLKPKELPYQQCEKFNLVIDPVPAQVSVHTDFFGNEVTWFSVQENHKKLVVKGISEIEVKTTARWETLLQNPITVAQVRQQLNNFQQWEARQFIFESPFIGSFEALTQYAAPTFAPDRPIMAALKELTQRIFKEFTFKPEATTVSTPLEQVMKEKKGVCQDFAQIGIGCLRAMGIPARYVSGYIETLPPPGKPKLQGTDASHAWISAFVPGHGWIDLDPTNNLLVGDQHITIAWGRDYSDVPPVKGVVFSGSGHKLHVSVDVTRINEQNAEKPVESNK